MVSITRSEVNLEAALREIGVDDLTKLRIVQYLAERPEAVASAPVLAASLGFHSVERTGEAAAGLVVSGVLEVANGFGGEPEFRLTNDPQIQAVTRLLTESDEKSGNGAQLMGRLARVSLARAQRNDAWGRRARRA